MWCFLHSLSNILAKIGLAAVVCPVSIIDSAETDDFDLRPDIDLTCDHLEKKFKIPFKSS